MEKIAGKNTRPQEKKAAATSVEKAPENTEMTLAPEDNSLAVLAVEAETSEQAIADGAINSSPTSHGEAASTENRRQPSNTKLTLERVAEVRDTLRREGRSLSQRNILKHLGGSFSTVSKILARLETLESEPMDLSITVSDATVDAIAADIRRHVEIYIESVCNKLAVVEAAKQDLLEARATIEQLQAAILEITLLQTKVAEIEGPNRVA